MTTTLLVGYGCAGLCIIGTAFVIREVRRWNQGPPVPPPPPPVTYAAGHMRYIRLQRRRTNTWLTVELPYPMCLEDCQLFAGALYRGWRFKSAMTYLNEEVGA